MATGFAFCAFSVMLIINTKVLFNITEPYRPKKKSREN